MKGVLKMFVKFMTLNKKDCSILSQRKYGERKSYKKPTESSLLSARTYGSEKDISEKGRTNYNGNKKISTEDK